MLIRSMLSSVSPVALFAPEKGAGSGGAGSEGAGATGEDTGVKQGESETEAGAAGESEADVEGEAEAGAKEGEGEGEAEAGAKEGEAEGEPEAVASAADWRDREIARKHRKLQDKDRENAELRRRLEDAQALIERGATPAEGAAEGEPAARRPAAPVSEDAVRREAARMVAQQTYDQQCNDTFEKGAKAYGKDWDQALKNLELLGGIGDDAEGVQNMSGILATDDPAQVLYKLGKNPDDYHRVMALPPARRLAEFVKLGIPAAPKPKPKPSKAPVPVEGITRRANANNDTDKLYDKDTKDDDWYKIRAAQKERRFKERQAAGRV